MALQGWDKNYREELKIQQEVIESLQQQLMISGATGQGGSPGQLYKPPVTNPGRGEAVFGTGKDGQRYFEFLKAMKINPNSIMLPFVPKDAESDDDYGEGDVPGHPDWKLAHGEGRGPQPKYHDEYNRELPIPPWMQMDPSGKLIEIPWMKEKYLNEHPELGLQISGMNYPAPSELDKWLQLYQKNGGSLRHLDPDMRRLILQRGVMKAQNLPANNIRRLRDTGHMTIPENADGTGPLRIIDSLGPQA